MLLVDDEPLVIDGLKFMVDWQRYGFQICGEACDGEDALDRIRELDPDLVVTDIRMPIVDGLQLIEQSTNRMQARCGFVILSGHEDFIIAHQALQFGVLDYWLKPINTEEIHLALEKLQAQLTLKHQDRSHVGLLEFPISSISEQLQSAENRLLLAIEAHDAEQIDMAVHHLFRQIDQDFEDSDMRRSYLESLLLELRWQTSEWDERGNVRSEIPVSNPFIQLECEQWLPSLTSLCQENASILKQQRAREGPVGDVVRYIRKEYTKPLRLQEVAKALHFQPAYLGQLFKKKVGLSFIDYLHRTRIEEASKLLRRTNLIISDVARTVGYTDTELFSYKFKKYMNIPPSHYKKS
ncbi:MAG: response regulator [Candidatus Cohnella colombiensis]|uniref:Response regulator n=1 Tax=Candidatus Cohnella colombiensis TaxID=3121368 RepID=A0AA95F4A2_9BACL|nr:MAG: response regulator [Cohnella sp.]